MGLEERAAAAVVAGEKAARSRRRGKKASRGGADDIGDAPNALSHAETLSPPRATVTIGGVYVEAHGRRVRRLASFILLTNELLCRVLCAFGLVTGSKVSLRKKNTISLEIWSFCRWP